MTIIEVGYNFYSNILFAMTSETYNIKKLNINENNFWNMNEYSYVSTHNIKTSFYFRFTCYLL